jgi:Arc/MetJ-type ribon-helix-helix transcriptional regulator
LTNNAKRRFSVTLTAAYIGALDRLVEEGLYIDHQDAIRDALRRLFQYHGIEAFSEKAKAPLDQ